MVGVGDGPVTVLALIAVVVLIVACGFFVAAEFALVAVDRTRVDRRAEEGGRRARIAQGLLTQLSFNLSGAQFGITVTSLLIGLLAEPAIAQLIEPALGHVVGERAVVGVSLVVAIAIATVVQMIVSELVPKGLAVARPEQVTFMVAPALRIYGIVFGPVIRVLDGAANRTVRRLGVEPAEELSHVRTLSELRLLVRDSSEGGTLDESASGLLTRSIRFGEKTAEDVLVARTAVRALQASRTVDDLVALSAETGFSRFPVYVDDLDDVIGTVHVRMAYSIDRAQRSSTQLSTIVRPVLAVPESRDLVDVLVDLRRADTHLAVVVDEYGGTAGILTVEDVLEEIVGEIDDEHDPKTALAGSTVGDWVLLGTLHPDEVLDLTGFTMPEGEYETLAGFLLDRLGHIPVVGEMVRFDGWTLRVVAMDRRRIAEVRLTSPEGGVR